MKTILGSLTVFAFVLGGIANVDASNTQFKCTLGADGKTVRVTVSHAFKQDAYCTVNCQFATKSAGTSFQVSCTKSVPAGDDSELCVKTYDKGSLTKMTGGDAECLDPTPKDSSDKDDADDDDAAMKDMQKMQREGLDMLRKMKKGE